MGKREHSGKKSNSCKICVKRNFAEKIKNLWKKLFKKKILTEEKLYKEENLLYTTIVHSTIFHSVDVVFVVIVDFRCRFSHVALVREHHPMYRRSWWQYQREKTTKSVIFIPLFWHCIKNVKGLRALCSEILLFRYRNSQIETEVCFRRADWVRN